MLRGPEPGREYSLEGPTHIIGRDLEAQVSVADPGLSRHHARISRTAHGDYLRDLESTNGTLVNGEKIETVHVLEEGDRIQLGRSTVLRYSRRDRLEQRAAEELYERSVRDPLTHLYNRRYLDDRLPSELAYAKRHGEHLTVLLLDLDHFKRINDRFGHQRGDQVLREVARRLQQTVRLEDVVARYGGEEFAIVALGIDELGARTFAERLRGTIGGAPIEDEHGALEVTVSIGLADSVVTGETKARALFAAADAALYEAKRKGRNRVEVAHGPER
ncbi:MAG: GGDEF domain-containing protein [Myxococcales bacterium]|nr:GGDEF domain-containing protein [Myxococcales bacterium]